MERINIRKVIERDMKEKAKRLDHIRRSCEYHKLQDLAVLIALDPEYLQRTS